MEALLVIGVPLLITTTLLAIVCIDEVFNWCDINTNLDCTRNDTCNRFGKCVDANEICECDAGYNSTDCGSCDFDHYNYPSCTCKFCYNLYMYHYTNKSCVDCEASLNCSGYGSCNATGQCDCFTTHNGNSSCDKCSVDHYDFPYCRCMSHCCLFSSNSLTAY